MFYKANIYFVVTCDGFLFFFSIPIRIVGVLFLAISWICFVINSTSASSFSFVISDTRMLIIVPSYHQLLHKNYVRFHPPHYQHMRNIEFSIIILQHKPARVLLVGEFFACIFQLKPIQLFRIESGLHKYFW